MQYRAGQVEHPPYVAALLLGQTFADATGEHVGLISIADNWPFNTLERNSSSNWRKPASNDSRP